MTRIFAGNFVALSFVGILCLLVPGHGRAASMKIDEVLKEYSKAAPSLERFYGHVTGRCEAEFFERSMPRIKFLDETTKSEMKSSQSTGDSTWLQKFPEVLSSREEIRFIVDRPRLKFDRKISLLKVADRSEKEVVWKILSDSPDAINRVVQATSGMQAFTLNWKSNSTTPVVKSIQASPADNTFTSLPPFLAVWAPFCLVGENLSDIIKRPSFRPKAVEEFEEAGKKLVRFSFDYKQADPLSKINGATVVLSPSEGWVMLSQSISHEKSVGLFSYKMKYRPGGEPLPVLTQVNRVSGMNRENYEFREISHAKSPELEFQTSFYGLPDLSQPSNENASSSFGPWIVAAAIVLFALAIWLRRFSSRRN